MPNDAVEASEGARAGDVEEIFVTATRRRENLRDVPQSVTALPERALEGIQADDFQDYAMSVRLTSVPQDNDLDGANDVDLALDISDPALAPLQPYRPAHGDGS